jgi:hypothetical protein
MKKSKEAHALILMMYGYQQSIAAIKELKLEK